MSAMEVTELNTQMSNTVLMKTLKVAIAPLKFQEKKWGVYITTYWVGSKQLDWMIFVHGMQKMFTDTVTSALIEKDKTKWVIQEEWSKKRSKSFKSLNYQQGLNRDNTIIIKQNKETKDDHVRPRTEEKELRMSKEQAKQTTKNQKHQKNVES